MAKEKTRWGAPWRLIHFTVGCEASSAVEGSFLAFQRSLGDKPKSFTGVVQGHVQKDKDKLAEEKRLVVNLQMLANNKTLLEQRSDPAKECAKIFLHATTERFEIANQDSQNYTCEEMTLPEDQLNCGVTCAHSVTCCTLAGKDDPPPPRVVEEINSIKY